MLKLKSRLGSLLQTAVEAAAFDGPEPVLGLGARAPRPDDLGGVGREGLTQLGHPL